MYRFLVFLVVGIAQRGKPRVGEERFQCFCALGKYALAFFKFRLSHHLKCYSLFANLNGENYEAETTSKSRIFINANSGCGL